MRGTGPDPVKQAIDRHRKMRSSPECPHCGGYKWPSSILCRACWGRLPIPFKTPLMNKTIDSEYVAAVERAIHYLEG